MKEYITLNDTEVNWNFFKLYIIGKKNYITYLSPDIHFIFKSFILHVQCVPLLLVMTHFNL